MCSNISGTEHSNWFTSYEHVHRMLTHHRHLLTVVGTIRGNKQEIPATFIMDRGRDRNTSLFGCQERCTLISYVPKKNKLVLLLSSVHNDDTIDESTGDAQKAKMIIFYNKTKGELMLLISCAPHIPVRLIYLCASYTCAPNTRRWSMVTPQYSQCCWDKFMYYSK